MSPSNSEEGDNSEKFVGMEQVVDEDGTVFYNGVKLGEYCSTDIQVAINEGNRKGDDFFWIRVGKAGTSMPFQQPIPLDFARFHQELHLQDMTLEVPCGRTWEVVVRAHGNVMRFGKGWKHFSVENSLREGCQLLFTLVGEVHFNVKFFDDLGKGHASFPPLAGAVQSQSLPRDDGERAIKLPPPPLKTPSAKAAATPPASAAAAPQGRPGALNSHRAKIILRQFLPQQPEAPSTVPNEDMPELEQDAFNAGSFNHGDGMETSEPVENQETHEQKATEEGKRYINLDSDDDNEIASPEASFTWNVPKVVTGTPSMLKDDEFYPDEQAGFHSPGRVHTRRNVKQSVGHQEHHAEMDQDSEDDDHFTESKTSSDYHITASAKTSSDDRFTTSAKTSSDDDIPLQHLQTRQRRVRKTSCHHIPVQIFPRQQRQVRKKVSVKRPSWQDKGKSKSKSKVPSSARFATFDDHREVRAATRSHRNEGRDTYGRRAAVQQRNAAVPEESMGTLSPSMRLLQQQRCGKFSRIVSKCKRRPVSYEQRSWVVNAAKDFALGLENEKFMVVMRDAQVYHAFHLAIPPEIMEVTGTVGANTVKAWLMGTQKSLYVANWSWHSFCETPLLDTDGWAKFAIDHSIEEGDVCVFELTKSGPAFISGFVFCVHIFRVTETPVKDCSSVHKFHGNQTPRNMSGMKSAAPIDTDWEPRLHNMYDTPCTPLTPSGMKSAAPIDTEWEQRVNNMSGMNSVAPIGTDWEPRLNNMSGMKSAAPIDTEYWEPRYNQDWKPRHDRGSMKQPIADLGRASVQKRIRKPINLQPWTKLIKPRIQGHFGGSRGQRQF